MELAELTGFEPATFAVTGRRSNQLSYSSNKLIKLLRLFISLLNKFMSNFLNAEKSLKDKEN
jgi:hypothetical protein